MKYFRVNDDFLTIRERNNFWKNNSSLCSVKRKTLPRQGNCSSSFTLDPDLVFGPLQANVVFLPPMKMFSKYVRKISRKTNISYLLIRTWKCAYQGVRNVSCSEYFAYVLTERTFTWKRTKIFSSGPPTWCSQDLKLRKCWTQQSPPPPLPLANDLWTKNCTSDEKLYFRLKSSYDTTDPFNANILITNTSILILIFSKNHQINISKTKQICPAPDLFSPQLPLNSNFFNYILKFWEYLL